MWEKTIGRHGFNGATAFRRWKLDNTGEWRTSEVELQWGHRLSAVETGKYDKRVERGELASMGPPPFGGGNI